MKTYLGWALAMTLVIVGACDDDDDSTTTLETKDQTFVLRASEANLSEIELGQLAMERSATPSVEAFGQMMTSEHQTALDELESIANNKKATMVTAMNAEHQQLKERLMGLQGYAFDTAYINSQVKDHAKVIALFQTQISL